MMGSRPQPNKTRLTNDACNARTLQKRSARRIASPSRSSPSPSLSSPSPSPSPPRGPLPSSGPSAPTGRTPLASITVHPGVVRSFPTAKVKRETPDDEIKEYAATAMSELLGWYGYDKVDSGCTRGLNLDHFAPPPPSRHLLHLPRVLSRSLTVVPSPRSQHSRSRSPPPINTASVTPRETGRPATTSSPLSLRTGPGSPRAPESSDTAPDTPDGLANCSWCGRAGGTWEPGGGSVSGGGSGSGQFCSEACFAAGRRAAFKRARTCDWCRHVRHSVSYVDFQDGESQLQFCSDKCLNQYKMNIFCRETQAHLELHGFAGGPSINGGAGVASGSLITPELWLRDCRSPPLSPKDGSPIADDDAEEDEEEDCEEPFERLASPSNEGNDDKDGTSSQVNATRQSRDRTRTSHARGDEERELEREREMVEREVIRETIKESLRDRDHRDLSSTRESPPSTKGIIREGDVPPPSVIPPPFHVTRERARDHTVADILGRDSASSTQNLTTGRDHVAPREGTIHIKDVRELTREPAMSRGRRSIRYARPRRVPRSPPWAMRESLQPLAAPINNRITPSPGNLLPKPLPLPLPQTLPQPQPQPQTQSQSMFQIGQLYNQGIYPTAGIPRPQVPMMPPPNHSSYPFHLPAQSSTGNPSLLPPVTVLVPYPIAIPIPVPIPIPIPIPLFGEYPPEKASGNRSESPVPEDLSNRGTNLAQTDPVDRLSAVTSPSASTSSTNIGPIATVTTTVTMTTTTTTTTTKGNLRARGRARVLSNNSDEVTEKGSPPLVLHLSQLTHLPQRTGRTLQRKRRRNVTETPDSDDGGDLELKRSSTNFVPAQ